MAQEDIVIQAFGDLCYNHPCAPVDFYCRDHEDAFCYTCKNSTHRQCNTATMDQIVQDEFLVLNASNFTRSTRSLKFKILEIKRTKTERRETLLNRRSKWHGFINICNGLFLHNTLANCLTRLVNRWFKPGIDKTDGEILECACLIDSLGQCCQVMEEVIRGDPRRTAIEHCSMKKLVHRVEESAEKLRDDYVPPDQKWKEHGENCYLFGLCVGTVSIGALGFLFMLNSRSPYEVRVLGDILYLKIPGSVNEFMVPLSQFTLVR